MLDMKWLKNGKKSSRCIVKHDIIYYKGKCTDKHVIWGKKLRVGENVLKSWATHIDKYGCSPIILIYFLEIC